MLVGSVIQYEVHQDADISCVRRINQGFEIGQCAIGFSNAAIVRDIIAIIPQWRGIDRHQPNTIYSKGLQVIELLRNAAQVAMAITIAVFEGPYRDLVKDSVFVPHT